MAQPLYFDYAATTPVDPRVFAAMRPFFLTNYGNPGSLHGFGQQAIGAVDQARETIAGLIGAQFREILFTGSATEANNLAIRGTVAAYRAAHDGAALTSTAEKNSAPLRIIVSAIEHESVLETVRAMGKEGIEVVEMPVDRRGRIVLEDLKRALTPETVLVSIMYANNEIGTVQPIVEIAQIIRNVRAEQKSNFPLLHTDAAQAFQFLECDVQKLGVDLMTLSPHKVYGPKGVGIVFMKAVKGGLTLTPFITGGGQEFGIRSGTENVPAIVGGAKALVLADQARAAERARVEVLSSHFLKQIKRFLPSSRFQLNGMPIDAGKESAQRLPNIVNIYLPKHLAADVVMQCDLAGLAISSGSACASRSYVPSYVIKALGYPTDRASESIRVSFGRPTKKTDIDRAVRIIRKSVE